jgi:hypothetical protein
MSVSQTRDSCRFADCSQKRKAVATHLRVVGDRFEAYIPGLLAHVYGLCEVNVPDGMLTDRDDIAGLKETARAA